MKVCKSCLINKELKEFYYCRNTKDKLMSKCVDCNTIYMKQYYKSNEIKAKENSRTNRLNRLPELKIYNENYRAKNYRSARNNRLKCIYGITIEDFEKLAKEQNYLCAICNKPQVPNKRHNNEITPLAVDHCHKTNKIRKLLCSNCNGALGLFKDNVEVMQKAIQYIKENK